MGFQVDQDFRGRYRASEGLLFLSYGLTDWLAIEVEAAVIHATLRKSASDPLAMPGELRQSGFGDRQVQLDFRWWRESPRRPELFGFLEVVLPSNRPKPLIGTSDWELKVGAGLTRGF